MIMEAVPAFAARRSEGMTSPASTPTAAEAGRALVVTATYLLSEDGRKASLLAGGDGRAIQELTVTVPANRLHLVSVDANGIARLKLRPRFQRDGDHGVTRIDAPPTYDTIPNIKDLFREAARNHQLEQTYEAERRAVRTTRRDVERDRRTQIAQAFLNDPTQRAVVHPAPTPKQCVVMTELGRLRFDAASDEVPARQVPEEAHRRFRADLRARKDRNQHTRAAQLAIHEEKKRAVAAWIAAHGTPEQQARQIAGVLPMAEAIDAMTDDAFAPVGDRARYARDGASRLQTALRHHAAYADVTVGRSDLHLESTQAPTATAAQWALVREFQIRLPEATVTLRKHRFTWARDPQAPALTVYGVLVTLRAEPFTLRREYVAPDADSA
jgi:hypothetical protein